MNDKQLCVCYFGTYRAGYSRNRIMIEGLRQNGVEVIECHQRLWHGIEDRVNAAGRGWLRPAFVCRVVRTYYKLLRTYRQIKEYDVMVLGYPGQMDACLARILTWLRRKPLVLDLFMSLTLIASERGLTARHPLTGRLIYWLEKLACLLPDLLIKDTAEYVSWFQRVYGLDPGRFRLVPTGADDRVFHPIEAHSRNDGTCWALYYGTFIPNHGVPYIVEAARILRGEPDLHFELVGDGPDKVQARALVKEYGLGNVTFVDWMEKEDLTRKASEAALLLGAFGTTPQSVMTIQNKIYEGLALRKCVVTGDSPTIRDTLTHGKHVWLCERADAESLAEAILILKRDPDLRRQLAENGYQLFREKYTVAALGQQFKYHLQALVEST